MMAAKIEVVAIIESFFMSPPMCADSAIGLWQG
jgi:hypothetical protein